MAAVGQAVIGTDRSGRIQYWNRAAQDLYCYTAQEVSGRPLFEVIAPPDAEHLVMEWSARLGADASYAGERPVRDKAGRIFTCFAEVPHERQVIAFQGLLDCLAPNRLQAASRLLVVRDSDLVPLGNSRRTWNCASRNDVPLGKYIEYEKTRSPGQPVTAWVEALRLRAPASLTGFLGVGRGVSRFG